MNSVADGTIDRRSLGVDSGLTSLFSDVDIFLAVGLCRSWIIDGLEIAEAGHLLYNINFPATASSQALELLNSTKKSRAQLNVDDLVSDPRKCPLSSHMILILEMIIENDAAYCLHSYLFKPDRGGQRGLPSRGHDESKESLNKGNLIELLNWYASRRKKINEVLFSNAPGNDQMTSPSIHKDLVNCCAVETTRSMINEMGNSFFSILVDESRDNSIKEQMTVVLRFVDKSGQVKERSLGISHIANTCAQSLKDDIDAMFSTHGLSISSLKGQGYDGASNISGYFNGLKALILRENPCAMFVHCFAHQLQLAVVSVAHRNVMISDLFNMLAIIVNLRLNIEELSSGTSQLQEMSLARPGDTRWGSHLKTITHFISMFNAIIDVLENISKDDISLE
ncbi:zinc finger MYM-type protein 1-like [Olea europaea var. sylvestris]|uniref:zinc finger MYM-type protein 1-like n=1 Tax=Olea europaea var. sylvestris TaxID=158386 RepID=UPI000C1D3103|nr:zinc finger MYM-type protein 1-like [Olea europaea var. sylvestris]